MRSACCIAWDEIVVVRISQCFISVQCVASQSWPRSVDSNNLAIFCLSMFSFVGGCQQGMALKNPAFSNWSQWERALCRCCANCRRCGSSTPDPVRVHNQKINQQWGAFSGWHVYRKELGISRTNTDLVRSSLQGISPNVWLCK